MAGWEGQSTPVSQELAGRIANSVISTTSTFVYRRCLIVSEVAVDSRRELGWITYLRYLLAHNTYFSLLNWSNCLRTL